MNYEPGLRQVAPDSSISLSPRVNGSLDCYLLPFRFGTTFLSETGKMSNHPQIRNSRKLWIGIGSLDMIALGATYRLS